MNKKIIGLIVAISVVGALIGTGTWALFSDIETSPDNTFTAGVIDLTISPTDGQEVTADVDLVDLKPCQTGYITITLTPTAESNPMHVWKRIQPCEAGRADNIQSEPECVECGGSWTGSACNYSPGESKDDIDRYIHFDMSIDATEEIPETEGWLISKNLADFPAVTGTSPEDNGVTGYWIYLGILDPTEAYAGSVDSMEIEESFHLDRDVTNWAQGDKLTFTEEFFALQVVGSPTIDDLPDPPGVEMYDHNFFSP